MILNKEIMKYYASDAEFYMHGHLMNAHTVAV